MDTDASGIARSRLFARIRELPFTAGMAVVFGERPSIGPPRRYPRSNLNHPSTRVKV